MRSLWISLTVQCLLVVAVTSLTVEPLIVKGSPAGLTDFPYLVSIRTRLLLHICGGSVYNPKWVVTAAHCTVNRTSVVVTTRNLLTNFVSDKIVNHASFNVPSLHLNDISLVKVVGTLYTSLSTIVAPIPLNPNVVEGNQPAVVAGWGATVEGGFTSIVLMWFNTTTMSEASCKAGVGPSRSALVKPEMICTSSSNGGSVCDGDSGGPLVMDNTVIGIVSWGVSCDNTYPNMFTRISSYITWVTNTVAAN